MPLARSLRSACNGLEISSIDDDTNHGTYNVVAVDILPLVFIKHFFIAENPTCRSQAIEDEFRCITLAIVVCLFDHLFIVVMIEAE